MKNERDPWVQVKDESELREGMAVQLRPCHLCGTRETFFLVMSGGDRDVYRADGRTLDPPEPGFLTIGRCDIGLGCGIAPRAAIRERRLYRLADDQLADDAEPATVVRGRETERAR